MLPATIQIHRIVSLLSEGNQTMLNRRAFIVLTLFLPLAGCLVTSDSKVSRSGNYIPESTFDRIEPGKTTAAWVKATLGDPTSKSSLTGENAEVWKWNYTEKKTGSGTLLFVFAGHSEDEKAHAAYVEFKDGVVTKKWRA
jgi:outer membrane protein assembly factor BamE (lipoprotein component of BamABCDE complex)